MRAFEFLISFYGILLGLSVAELASGLSRTWDRRATHKFGWLAPLIGLIILADLVSFWTNTWGLRDTIQVGYHVAFGAAIVTLLYYFAATQVFPRDGSALTPDEHVMAHRKPIVLAASLSNILASIGAGLILGASPADIGFVLLLNLPLFILFAAIGWLPGRRSVLAVLLLGLPFIIFYEPIVRWLARLIL